MLKARLKSETFLSLLRAHNMSIREFARNEGVSDCALVQCVNGTRCPGPKVRQAIMEGTGLEFDDLFEILWPGEQA